MEAIKATELRIGNHLEYFGKFITVEQIRKENTQYYIWTRHQSGTICNVLDAFSPIPLSEEVLRAAGFAMDEDEGCYKHTSRHCVNIEPDGSIAFFLYEPWGGYKTLHYVHQLQNLYFALTGQELSVSLIAK